MKLVDFFDPSTLENLSRDSSGLYEDGDSVDITPSAWFTEASRVACAAFAITALANSLSNGSKKYQNLLAVSTQSLILNAAFWLARGGPYELIIPALNLLQRVLSGNADVLFELSQAVITIGPGKRGINVPPDFDRPVSLSLMYGWKPLPNEDKKVILHLFA